MYLRLQILIYIHDLRLAESSGICRIISSYSWIRPCDNEKNPAKYNWSTQKNNNDSAAMLNFQQ